jgi:peptidoglycan-associated lipoprotein
MDTTFRLLLLVTAASALVAGCASHKKASPTGGATMPGSAEAQLDTRLPPEHGPASGGVVRGSQEDLAATAGERVYFALDSDAIDDAASLTLRAQAAWLRSHPNVRARIAGNADERGTREYNLALGAKRAAAARQGLISNGIEATRLETISFGKERPLDPGANEEAWAKNRNAQTIVIELGAR